MKERDRGAPFDQQIAVLMQRGVEAARAGQRARARRLKRQENMLKANV